MASKLEQQTYSRMLLMNTGAGVTTDHYEQAPFGKLSSLNIAVKLKSIYVSFNAIKGAIIPTTPPAIRFLWQLSAKRLDRVVLTSPVTPLRIFIEEDADLIVNGEQQYDPVVLGGSWQQNVSIPLHEKILPRFPSFQFWGIKDGTTNIQFLVRANLFYRLQKVSEADMRMLMKQFIGRKD